MLNKTIQLNIQSEMFIVIFINCFTIVFIYNLYSYFKFEFFSEITLFYFFQLR